MRSQDRPVPDFLVIGAMRAGTTTLFHALSQCGRVSLPAMKETDYFVPDASAARGFSWYRSQFDLTADICGEVCPNYAKRDIFPGVADRVAAASPDTKIIYVLRDPVERAFSQYKFQLLMGYDLPDAENLLETPDGQHILNTSRYFWQLEPWRQNFADDAILLLPFEDVKDNLPNTVEKIGAFLRCELELPQEDLQLTNSLGEVSNVPDWWRRMRRSPFGSAVRRHVPRKLVNITKKALRGRGDRQEVHIPDDLARQLADRLAPDAEQLRELSGEKFVGWSV